MPNITLRVSGAINSANATFKNAPLTNLEIDNNFSNLNITVTELANASGVVAATYGGSSNIAVITVNSRGAITSASNVAVAGVSGFTNNGAGSAGFTISTAAGSSFGADLPTSGVTAATYGSSTNIPVLVVDSFGRINSASNVSVTIGTSLVDQTSSASTHYPLLSTANTGSISGANISTSKLYFVPSTGTLYSTIFQSLSDPNFKTNIQLIDQPFNVINSINGYTFNWRDNGEKSSGVLAPELEQVAPHLVAGDEEGYSSVNYNGIIAYLIECVKHLDQRVKELENKHA